MKFPNMEPRIRPFNYLPMKLAKARPRIVIQEENDWKKVQYMEVQKRENLENMMEENLNVIEVKAVVEIKPESLEVQTEDKQLEKRVPFNVGSGKEHEASLPDVDC